MLIGESCLDEYHYGECRRLSPEAPVPVLDLHNIEVFPGMAANVEQNLESFGVEVDFITNNSEELIKKRFVDAKSQQQILREDMGAHVDPFDLASIENLNDYDAIIFSDYDKGLISWESAEFICKHYDGLKFVDSKKCDLTCYTGAVIKVNEYEAEDALALPERHTLIVTKGSKGAEWNNTLYEAPPVSVYDVSGAGDVFLATLASTLCRENNYILGMPFAIKKAVAMASLSVQHSGTYKLTKEDIKS